MEQTGNGERRMTELLLAALPPSTPVQVKLHTDPVPAQGSHTSWSSARGVTHVTFWSDKRGGRQLSRAEAEDLLGVDRVREIVGDAECR